MKVSIVDSPRKIAKVPRFMHVHMRVASGTVLLARDNQTLIDGGGLSVSAADGILSLPWDTGDLWMAAYPQGTTAQIEMVLPS